ncbi:phytanoyl-CoA dioxygenase family protein, partial [Sphingomonas sp. YL-JM2C]
MTVQTLPNTASTDEIVDVLNRDGGVILENFLTDEVLGRLRADLGPLLEATPASQEVDFLGTKTRRLSRLFSHTRAMADVVTNPLFHDAAQAILAKPVHVWFGEGRTEITPDIRVGMAQAIQIWPGQGSQPLHRDDTVFLWRHPTGGREARLQIMIAITDFEAENGGTLVVPGSHLWDDERMPERHEGLCCKL